MTGYKLLFHTLLAHISSNLKLHLIYLKTLGKSLSKNFCFKLFPIFRWKPQDHGNVARIDMKVKEMWMPDIIFFTQLSGEHFNEEFPSPPALLSNGVTMVLKPFKAELVCVMDAWYFPYDYQVCLHYYIHIKFFFSAHIFNMEKNHLKTCVFLKFYLPIVRPGNAQILNLKVFQSPNCSKFALKCD